MNAFTKKYALVMVNKAVRNSSGAATTMRGVIKAKVVNEPANTPADRPQA